MVSFGRCVGCVRVVAFSPPAPHLHHPLPYLLLAMKCMLTSDRLQSLCRGAPEKQHLRDGNMPRRNACRLPACISDMFVHKPIFSFCFSPLECCLPSPGSWSYCCQQLEFKSKPAIVLRYLMSCDGMLCYAIPCHAMPSHLSQANASNSYPSSLMSRPIRHSAHPSFPLPPSPVFVYAAYTWPPPPSDANIQHHHEMPAK